MFLVIGGLSMMSHHYTLGNIKSRTVGDGQHGTARWATDSPNKHARQPVQKHSTKESIPHFLFHEIAKLQFFCH